MSILNGKNILLGISGGIAAYKSPFLVRLLIKSGANVQVIMTPSSKDFVTPLTFLLYQIILFYLTFLVRIIKMNYGIIMLSWVYGQIILLSHRQLQILYLKWPLPEQIIY